MKNTKLISYAAGVALLIPVAGAAVVIDFDDLPDQVQVGDFYQSTYGVDFQSAVSLTAGYSLNEIDFPPRTGMKVIGDSGSSNGVPMVITFVNPANSVSGYFAYKSRLTFAAFDSSGNPLGTYVTPNTNRLGTNVLISLPVNNISELRISGTVTNSFVLDHLSFE